MTHTVGTTKDARGPFAWDTLGRWHESYTYMIARYLIEVDGMELGEKGGVVVWDEAYARSQHGVHKQGTPARKGARISSNHIEAHLFGPHNMEAACSHGWSGHDRDRKAMH